MQYKLLKSLVYRLYSFSPFYHDRMKEQKVHPDDIKELSDVKKLPFMFKRDLRDSYPDKIFTASQEELVRYHVSSGTTGKPTVVGYTQNDIDLWTACAGPDLDRPRARRCYPGELRVWPLHRRPWHTLRCRTHRCNRPAHKCRQHGAPDRADAGSRGDRNRLHSVLPSAYRRGCREDGGQH